MCDIEVIEDIDRLAMVSKLLLDNRYLDLRRRLDRISKQSLQHLFYPREVEIYHDWEVFCRIADSVGVRVLYSNELKRYPSYMYQNFDFPVLSSDQPFDFIFHEKNPKLLITLEYGETWQPEKLSLEEQMVYHFVIFWYYHHYNYRFPDQDSITSPVLPIINNFIGRFSFKTMVKESLGIQFDQAKFYQIIHDRINKNPPTTVKITPSCDPDLDPEIDEEELFLREKASEMASMVLVTPLENQKDD